VQLCVCVCARARARARNRLLTDLVTRLEQLPPADMDKETIQLLGPVTSAHTVFPTTFGPADAPADALAASACGRRTAALLWRMARGLAGPEGDAGKPGASSAGASVGGGAVAGSGGPLPADAPNTALAVLQAALRMDATTVLRWEYFNACLRTVREHTTVVPCLRLLRGIMESNPLEFVLAPAPVDTLAAAGVRLDAGAPAAAAATEGGTPVPPAPCCGAVALDVVLQDMLAFKQAAEKREGGAQGGASAGDDLVTRLDFVGYVVSQRGMRLSSDQADFLWEQFVVRAGSDAERNMCIQWFQVRGARGVCSPDLHRHLIGHTHPHMHACTRVCHFCVLVCLCVNVNVCVWACVPERCEHPCTGGGGPARERHLHHRDGHSPV
jgi:hypothetical protein